MHINFIWKSTTHQKYSCPNIFLYLAATIDPWPTFTFDLAPAAFDCFLSLNNPIKSIHSHPQSTNARRILYRQYKQLHVSAFRKHGIRIRQLAQNWGGNDDGAMFDLYLPPVPFRLLASAHSTIICSIMGVTVLSKSVR